MYVVIAGCGRVGSSLAQLLVSEGHEVAVIDEDPEAFTRLGEEFPAEFITGAAIDWEIMEEAGVGRADAFVSATDGDNTNIVAAQIAKEHFGVQCVVARVYDPARAELFATAGIRTVCPTKDAKDMLADAVHSCRIPGR